jgi:hypothetical protein
MKFNFRKTFRNFFTVIYEYNLKAFFEGIEIASTILWRSHEYEEEQEKFSYFLTEDQFKVLESKAILDGLELGSQEDVEEVLMRKTQKILIMELGSQTEDNVIIKILEEMFAEEKEEPYILASSTLIF